MKRRNTGKGRRIGPIVKMALIGVVTYILLFGMVLLGITPEQHDIQIGAPAAIDILATKDVNDVVTTEKHREIAAAAVEPSYKSVDNSVVGLVISDTEAIFNTLVSLRENTTSEAVLGLTEDQLKTVNGALPFSMNREQFLMLVEADETTLKALFTDVLTAVRDTLNSTLPEGQEAAAVTRISRGLSSNGYSNHLVSLCTEVIRNTIKPNMLIDEEITEANRQKARDAVEMETCIKGEMIVREGEIVTEAQYMMISSLGLLKEDSIDIPLIAGIGLIIMVIFASQVFYLYRFEQNYANVRTIFLMCLIILLVVAICWAVSTLNPYMMPVSLGVLLISQLLGRNRLALYVSLAIGFIASLFTDASSGLFTMTMFSVVLMSLVAGPIVLAVYTHRSQRTTTLLAGCFLGISNFLVTFAVGIINSAELKSVSISALWSMFGGFLSAILCIGFQPLLEWMFNIATSAKLIELSNPNQPLLRRLLLEAPGTYHHSIIVANLAEAASNAIGANGLLARVGAYYHDVGKLKRPIYFKENQMGDNPHDRTDPRVSTAILTAHTRDGYQMAQKARIPRPVLDIIRQHHGDSPVLFFYDKAIKLYGEDTDISSFRYEGPRPSSKEAAAVMLADTIEAAARSIPNPTPEKIDALIRKLVRNKMDDGQLNESDLTLNDLERICSAFSTVLTGVFHERIEYPDVVIPARAEPVETPVQPAPAPEAPAQEPSEPEVSEVGTAETEPTPEVPAEAPAEPEPCEVIEDNQEATKDAD